MAHLIPIIPIGNNDLKECHSGCLATQRKLVLTIRVAALTLGSKSCYFCVNNENNLAHLALHARKGLCYRAALHK
jgi:hypothetical protein